MLFVFFIICFLHCKVLSYFCISRLRFSFSLFGLIYSVLFFFWNKNKPRSRWTQKIAAAAASSLFRASADVPSPDKPFPLCCCRRRRRRRPTAGRKESLLHRLLPGHSKRPETKTFECKDPTEHWTCVNFSFLKEQVDKNDISYWTRVRLTTNVFLSKPSRSE